MTDAERIAALETRMQDMLDREAIFACIRQNSRGNDRFDLDLVTRSYHPDGRHELGAELIDGLRYGEHANAAHNHYFELNLHNITMQRCEIDGDVAHAESYVIGLFADKGGMTSRMLAGRYIDRLERRDGEWRIALRRATVEVAMEGKAILPNGKVPPGSGYLKGDRDRSDPSYERPLSTHSGTRW